MKNFIKKIHLRNFKSVKDVSFLCKRVNIFIGKPNSGKSNLLEAISILGRNWAYIREQPNQWFWFKNEVRYEKFLNLFRFQNGQEPISLSTEDRFYEIRQYASRNLFEIFWGDNSSKFLLKYKIKPSESLDDFQKRITHLAQTNFKAKSKLKSITAPFLQVEGVSLDGSATHSPLESKVDEVKKYFYKEQKIINSPYSGYLLPSGENLFTIIEHLPSLSDFVGKFFNEYGLEFVMDSDSKQFEIHRKVGRVTYKIPFSLTPDTVQRTLYHLAAIESNHDSILLFEEPEAHSFPEYIQLVARKIIEAKQNQFFIATHSPYLLNTFLDNKQVRKELSIFITTYEDAQTKVKRLSEMEVSQIHNYGVDIFSNLKSFIK